MTYQDIIDVWNQQPENHKLWADLSEFEKIEFAYFFGFESCLQAVKDLNNLEEVKS